jgi:hypothetical protein
MSRLTLPHYGGKGHYMKCSEQFGCSGECTDCEELDKIVEKLAEYEDKEALNQQTNADRIRAMSDEELKHIARAVIEAENCPMGKVLCIDCVFHDLCLRGDYYYNNEEEWLQQPAREG